ncbi:MAG: endonuclease III [Candidatus Woesearchaeota archaeon]|nr:endonuclease III [Candidatus Woesearchaeota archaeon]
MNSASIDTVYQILEKEVKNYKVPIVDLIKIQTNDPEKVLIATILSARTKDQTTAAACRKLFSRIHHVADLGTLSEKEIEQLIYPVGFYKTKARHLKQLPLVLQEKFGGTIPQTVEELIELPGVGRKTANLVVAVGFQKPGMCVDTHVHRISNRLGYVKTKTPYETEMALRKKLPKEYWEKINSMLVAFGQHTCTPISPHCSRCPIRKYCKQVGVVTQR